MNAVIQNIPPGELVVGRYRTIRYIQILIVFLPILLTFFYIHSLSVETPMQDDWDLFVPHLQHLAAGHLQWSDLNSQHNESLVFFPLSASLVLEKLAGGRLLAVTYLSYSFSCGALGVLFLFFRMLHLPGRWSDLWFLPASLLFLGWRQWEGLLSSTHLVNTMALFFVLAALYGCTQVLRAPIFFLAAIACAWIASFSMASGLIVWFCGAAALVIALAGKMPFEQALRHYVGWSVMALVCGGCFFLDAGPHPVPWPSGVAFVAAHPFDAVHYALTYLGSPLGANALQATFVGTAFVSIAVPVLFLALRKFRTDGMVPSLLIVGYVGVALIPLLVGRLGLGIGQAFSSRYVLVGSLAPIGVYFCSLTLARSIPVCRYLAIAMFLLMAVGIVSSYSSGLTDGRKESALRSGCASAIKNFHHVERTKLLCGYPDPGVILERAPWLEQYHLSLFGK